MSESRWDTGRDNPDAGADPIAEGIDDEELPPASEREAEEEVLSEEDGPPRS